MGWIAVDSDPRRARIIADGQDTGLLTPDTLKSLTIGHHEIRAVLDTAGFTYSYGVNVRTVPDTVIDVTGPLLARCVSAACAAYVQPNRIRLALRPVPALFFVQGQGAGLFWPGDVANSYGSGAAPVFAALLTGGLFRGDTVAMGPYDVDFFAARPAVTTAKTANATTISSPSWVLPPRDFIIAGAIVPRGLSVRQKVLAPAEGDAEDMLFVRVTATNISGNALYRLADPVAAQAFTFQEMWLGFAFDFDIGTSEDDLVTYVPDLDLAIAYDSDFREDNFQTGWRNRPAIIGLRMIARPAGAEQVILNAYEREAEWSAAGANQRFGWRWLSGTQITLGNHPDPRIGYAPTVPADLRMSVSAGPLTLAPGDSTSFVVAIVFASPEPGTFTSGQIVQPGDPLARDRTILRIAGPLIRRAADAAAVWARLAGTAP